LGTPKPDQWREGYKLAEKRQIKFNEYPKQNLTKVIPGLTDEGLEAIRNMLKISASKRLSPGELLQMPYFKYQ